MPRVLIPGTQGTVGTGNLRFHYGEGLSHASEVAVVRRGSPAST